MAGIDRLAEFTDPGFGVTLAEFNPDAHLLRDVTESLGLEVSIRKVARLLASCMTPHLVGGGFAVQERGYPRYYKDLELIVPDPDLACQLLILSGAYQMNTAAAATIIDDETGVAIHFLKGGSASGGGPVKLPMPVLVSGEPMVLGLAELISIKLSGFVAGGIRRAQDAADVVELIKRTRSPRDLAVDATVRDVYLKILGQLNGEPQPGEWRLF